MKNPTIIQKLTTASLFMMEKMEGAVELQMKESQQAEANDDIEVPAIMPGTVPIDVFRHYSDPTRAPLQEGEEIESEDESENESEDESDNDDEDAQN
jgi:hypothetical protein